MRALILPLLALALCLGAGTSWPLAGTALAETRESLVSMIPARDGARRCYGLKAGGFSLNARLRAEARPRPRTLDAATFMLHARSRSDDADGDLLYLFYMETRFRELTDVFRVDGYCENDPADGAVSCMVECDGGRMRVAGDGETIRIDWSGDRTMRLTGCGTDSEVLFAGPTGAGDSVGFRSVPAAACAPIEAYFLNKAKEID